MMATPLFDKSSPSTRIVSPPETCEQKLRTDPPAGLGDNGNCSLDRELEQEKAAGGESSIRYSNNPYGTILSTNVEQESHASLQRAGVIDEPEPFAQADSNSNVHQFPLLRARVEQGLDPAALSEFQTIVNAPTVPTSLSEVAKDSRTNDLAESVVDYVGSSKDKQVVVPGDPCTCGSEQSSLPGTPIRPIPSRVALAGSSSTKRRPECSSPKHLVHIFPDFIQLGSLSRGPDFAQSNSVAEPKTRLRTNSVVSENESHRIGNSEGSYDSTNTRYLPPGFIPFPPTHISRRRVKKSSLSTHKSSSDTILSLIINNAGSPTTARPKGNRSDGHETDISGRSHSPLTTNHEPSASNEIRFRGHSGENSYDSLLENILEYYNVFAIVNELWPTSGCSDSPTQEQRVRIFSAAAILTGMERSQSLSRHPSEAAEASSTHDSSRYATYHPSRTHSSYERRPASSSHDTRGTARTGTLSTRTFRSAALESLLPIAAAEGIIIPYTLTPRRSAQAQTPSIPSTRFETSHSELTVLYHRNDVCRHRAAAYKAKGVEPRDTLLQMLETVCADGAEEVKEKKDWCWRCRLQKKWSNVAGVVMPKSCCAIDLDKADEIERARYVEV